MATRTVQHNDTASQRDKFIEAARELGCDESEEAFAEKVRKVARSPAPAKDKPAREPRRRG